MAATVDTSGFAQGSVGSGIYMIGVGGRVMALAAFAQLTAQRPRRGEAVGWPLVGRGSVAYKEAMSTPSQIPPPDDPPTATSPRPLAAA